MSIVCVMRRVNFCGNVLPINSARPKCLRHVLQPGLRGRALMLEYLSKSRSAWVECGLTIA